MIIIEREAEKKLLEELNHIKEEVGYRFIHYNFSQLDDKKRSVVQGVVTASVISKILDNASVKAFVCQDHDLIITGLDIYSKAYNNLGSQLDKLCEAVNLQDYSKIYNIDDNWVYLHKLAQDKCNSINTEKQLRLEKIRKEKEASEIEKILSGEGVDKQLLDTIFERREGRSGVDILIVEDDAFSRKLIRNVLSKEYNVTDVEDGKDAVNSYITMSPDVVFLDIDLPDINGHEILNAILKFDPKAYIVMLSGNTDQQNVVKAIEAGAKGFVAKPFLKDRLYKYINECPTVMVKTNNANIGT